MAVEGHRCDPGLTASPYEQSISILTTNILVMNVEQWLRYRIDKEVISNLKHILQGVVKISGAELSFFAFWTNRLNHVEEEQLGSERPPSL